jgi:hypothetical protein
MNNGQFPSSFSQLQPYFEKSTDGSVFQRYQITQAQLQLEVNEFTKTAQQVYRMNAANTAEINSSQAEWVIMEKSPLYKDDAQIVVTSTGVHLQTFQ